MKNASCALRWMPQSLMTQICQCCSFVKYGRRICARRLFFDHKMQASICLFASYINTLNSHFILLDYFCCKNYHKPQWQKACKVQDKHQRHSGLLLTTKQSTKHIEKTTCSIGFTFGNCGGHLNRANMMSCSINQWGTVQTSGVFTPVLLVWIKPKKSLVNVLSWCEYKPGNSGAEQTAWPRLRQGGCLGLPPNHPWCCSLDVWKWTHRGSNQLWIRTPFYT